MTRLFIGNKPGVGGVVKVMVNDADDPLTTPNANYSKFKFNSESTDIGYISETYTKQWNVSSYPCPSGAQSYYLYYPNGGTNLTATDIVLSWTYGGTTSTALEQHFVINFSKKYGFNYPPIFEVRRKLSSGRFSKGHDAYSQVSGFEAGSYYFYGNLVFSSHSARTWKSSSGGFRGFTNGYFHYKRVYEDFGTKIGSSGDYMGAISFSGNDGIQFEQFLNRSDTALASIWELPANNTPLPAASSPVGGQKNVVFSPTLVRISMAGYDVNTADRNHLILDSTKVPAKIIKTGEIFVPANGSATVNTPSEFPLNGNVYVDYIGWESSQPLYIPYYKFAVADFSNSEIVIDYQIATNSVTFFNIRANGLTIRYMIIADDDTPPSTGGGKVIDTQSSYVRILRPGSNSANPSWSDILLDTRLSYLPILAEGYIPIGSFVSNTVNVPQLGAKKSEITFANGGLKPFLKFSAEMSDGSFMPPVIRKSVSNWNSSLTVAIYRHSIFASLTDTGAIFYTNPTGPADVYFDNAIPNFVSDNDSGPSVVGVRYYVLGLKI
ncbi:MAG: hypothetical protein ACEQSB_00360 [Undibacterium sp.]